MMHERVGDTGSRGACRCDERPAPRGQIPPFLATLLPRRTAALAGIKAAMLSSSRAKPSLAAWTARARDDLGVMLLELGAYVLDVLSLYDVAIANECYVRTARRRSSVRKLVALLGYRPRPAVAATATLAALAEGRGPVVVPAGTTFRSGAFDGQPPQVFELDAASEIHPLMNRWSLKRPRRETIGPSWSRLPVAKTATLLLVPETARLRRGDALIVQTRSRPGRPNQVRLVTDVRTVAGSDGERYARVQLDCPVTFPRRTKLSDVSLLVPTAQARTRRTSVDGDGVARARAALAGTRAAAMLDGGAILHEELRPEPGTIAHATDPLPVVALEGAHPAIRRGDVVVLQLDAEVRWFTVAAIRDQTELGIMSVTLPGTAATGAAAGDTPVAQFDVPTVGAPTTLLTLDAPLNALARSNRPDELREWTDLDRVTVLHGLSDAGVLTIEADETLTEAGPFVLAGPVEAAGSSRVTRPVALVDRNDAAVQLDATIDFGSTELTPSGAAGRFALAFPVEARGNLLTVTRGETVTREVLGSGDVSQTSQSFKLAKKPLTYLARPGAAGDSGIESTLEVRVDGILWEEVASFFGAGAEDPIYVVREDDDGSSSVTFGDGVRGARLPSGAGNVVARYRHGAGRAAPPAGSITQIARPVKRLTSVKQPLPAGGGADPASRELIQALAPRSALILGRIVSTADAEAVAAQYPAVRAASARWAWDGMRQRPVILVVYAADTDLSAGLLQRMQALTDPSTPLVVRRAEAVVAHLGAELAVDPRHLAGDVRRAVAASLLRPGEGLLVPERLGIGAPLYRSRILEAILAVEGVSAVRALTLNGESFDRPGSCGAGDLPQYARTPGAERYFDFETGGVGVTGGIGE